VGSYQPNRLGLYYMCGNVWEWCDDAEKTADGAPHRVARGGSWVSRPGHCRAAYRDVYPLSLRDAKVGLRVSRVPVGKEIVRISPDEKQPADVVPGPPAVGPKPIVATTAPAPKISGRPFLIRGQWSIENDELVQPKLAAGHEHPLIVLGEPALSHYDLTLEAKETGGNEALGIFFHWLGPRHYRKFFLAANRELNFSYSYDGKWSREDGRKRLSYSSNQWYSLKLEVRGDTFRAYLDGVLQFEQIDERFTHGRICLFTNDTAARFRRIKVTDPQGKVLFEGLPELPNASNKRP
jgi:Sulfatase-modifying factor enzyme 1